MNRIREARKQAGIKQIDLCARLGISQGALSGWENGKYEPGSAGWLSLSEALGVSVDYLMGVTEEKKKRPSPIQRMSAMWFVWPDVMEAMLFGVYRMNNTQPLRHFLNSFPTLIFDF